MMKKGIKYSLGVLMLICFVSGCLYFYLMKDGFLVTFNSNGGSIVAPVKTGMDKKLEEPDEPEKEGYTFDGWYLGDEKFNFEQTVLEDITLVAHWEEEQEVFYTLAFDSLGGSPVLSEQVAKGTVLEVIPQTSRDGYQFIGWYYHNQEFDFKRPIEQNMVLVAKYQKILEEKKTALITFDSNGGSEISSVQVEIGSLAKMPKEPTKDGYKFVGWHLNDQEFTFLEPVYEDITLKALWESL